MTRKKFKQSATLSCGRYGRATIIVLAISTLLGISSSSAQKISSQRLQRKQLSEIAGVRFAAPLHYRLEQSSDARVAFMRHPTVQIALFVAVTDHQVDDEYLTNLSNNLVSQLLPQQNAFSWKILERASSRKVSKYQTGGGTAKGLNAKKFIQADYLVVKAQGHEIVVGSIAPFGEEREAKFLFEVEGREYSFLGWQALFELLESITGEKR